MELKSQPDVKRGDVLKLPLSVIRVEPGFNVRADGPEKDAHVREIADSMLAIKFRQSEPLIVFNDGNGAVIVEGHCRWEAVLLANSEGAGILRVPCLPLPNGTTEAERIMAMLAADGKKPLKPLEQADGVYRLINAGWDEEKIDRARGKSRGWAARMLLLRGSPEPLRQAVANGEIAPTEAVKLARMGPIEATATLAKAKEARAPGKTKVTAATIARAAPENNSRLRNPTRTPAERSIDRFLAVWESWPIRKREAAMVPVDVLAAIEQMREH